MRSFVAAFARDQRGATAIEYGMICALIFVVIIASVEVFASKSASMFAKISAAVGGAI